MPLLLGKPPASLLHEQQTLRVLQLRNRGVHPRLDIVLLCNELEESPYVLAKKKACQAIGLECVIHHLPLDTEMEDLLSLIESLNHDPDVHAIICQLPLPPHINTAEIVCSIDKSKDVDGFHPENIGLLALGCVQRAFVPCTPAAILHLLQFYKIPLMGKDVTILGRSRIVGLPLQLLLSTKEVGATVTLCHTQTHDIKSHCLKADILVSAVGQPGFVKKDWLNPQMVIVDVGITRVPNANSKTGFALVGDLDPQAREIVETITPVPGGVGPLTVAMVLQNCLKAWEAAFFD